MANPANEGLQTQRIIMDIKRQGEVVDLTGVLDRLPEVCRSVRTDLPQLQARLREVMMGDTKNPINALLGLFKLRIVNPENSIRRVEVIEEGDEGQPLDLCCVDGADFEQSARRIAAVLAAYEKDMHRAIDERNERINQLVMELNQKNREHEQLQEELSIQTASVAEHMRYLLAMMGRNAVGTPGYDQVIAMLETMGVTVRWDAVENGLPLAAMFTTLQAEDVSAHREQPCLMQHDRVLCKGLRFVAVKE